MIEDGLRILHVSPYVVPNPSLGGVPQSVRALCEALQHAGYDVTIWGSDIGSKVTKTATNDHDAPQIQMFPAKFGVLGRVLNTPVVPELMLVNARMVQQFDIVHLHGYWTSFTPSLAWACRRANIPFILQPRGSLVHSNQKEVLKLVYRGLFQRRIIDATAMAIALTPDERSQLLADGFEKSRVRTIPNFIVPPSIPLPPIKEAKRLMDLPPNSQVILYLGRLHRAKGIKELVQAFAVVKRSLPTAVLVIAGPDEGMLPELAMMVKHSKIPDVRFLGALDETARWVAYASASVFCLPSIFEAFPRVVLEAAVVGVPIVLSRTLSLPHFLEADAVVLSDTTPVELAEGLTRVLSDPGLQTKLAGNAKRCCDQFFSVPAVLSLLQDAYTNAMQRTAT